MEILNQEEQVKKQKKNKNLKKAGWTFKKGSFGAVRVEEKKKGKKKTKGRKSTKKRGRKQRGGATCGAPPPPVAP